MCEAQAKAKSVASLAEGGRTSAEGEAEKHAKVQAQAIVENVPALAEADEMAVDKACAKSQLRRKRAAPPTALESIAPKKMTVMAQSETIMEGGARAMAEGARAEAEKKCIAADEAHARAVMEAEEGGTAIDEAVTAEATANNVGATAVAKQKALEDAKAQGEMKRKMAIKGKYVAKEVMASAEIEEQATEMTKAKNSESDKDNTDSADALEDSEDGLFSSDSDDSKLAPSARYGPASPSSKLNAPPGQKEPPRDTFPAITPRSPAQDHHHAPFDSSPSPTSHHHRREKGQSRSDAESQKNIAAVDKAKTVPKKSGNARAQVSKTSGGGWGCTSSISSKKSSSSSQYFPLLGDSDICQTLYTDTEKKKNHV